MYIIDVNGITLDEIIDKFQIGDDPPRSRDGRQPSRQKTSKFILQLPNISPLIRQNLQQFQPKKTLRL